MPTPPVSSRPIALFACAALTALWATSCNPRVGLSPGFAPPPPTQLPLGGHEVIVAEEVFADRILAEAILTRELHIDRGQVGMYRPIRALPRERRGTVTAEHLDAQIVIADRVHAGWIEVAEVHAREVFVRGDRFFVRSLDQVSPALPTRR